MMTNPKTRSLQRSVERMLATASLVVACLASASLSCAQITVPPPTTRILAIGTVNPNVAADEVQAILPAEVRSTVALYLAGRIDQWYSLQGRAGVVFILNTTDLAAAHEMLESLPMGQAHVMTFELLPLGPLAPLRQLR